MSVVQVLRVLLADFEGMDRHTHAVRTGTKICSVCVTSFFDTFFDYFFRRW
jgi:hypothetical protein